MPWDKTREDRRRDAEVYGAAYRRARDAARRRARGICEGCGHAHRRLECDHIVPASQGGTHALSNLRMLCKGPGTCGCHEAKTGAESNANRIPADPPCTPRTVW